jgi:hypothetical protein
MMSPNEALNEMPSKLVTINAGYVAAVAAGNQPVHEDPFDVHLTDATDELQDSFDALIPDKRLNNIYTPGGVAVINATNADQKLKIERVKKNFRTVHDQLDWLEANALQRFVYKCNLED